jgi:iron complex transport system substrate-binding protein
VRPSRRRGLATRTVILGVAVALALLVAACGSSGSTQPGAGSAPDATGGVVADPAAVAIVPVADHPVPELPATVTSADGREVTVTDVSRIVPLWGNLSEIVFALGLGDNVVGRDISATFPEAEHLPLVTRSHDVSAEAVLSLRPTVVLAQTDSGPPEALDHIRAAGVPVVVLDLPEGIDDITPRIQLVADALGVPEAGAELAARTEGEILEVQEAIPSGDEAPKVAFLYLRGQAGVYLIAGPGSGADSMIQAAGGVDAGTAMGLDQPFTPLTSEALVQAAPEAILMTTTGLESVGGIDGLVEIPGIAQTPAGQGRRVITVEDSLLYSFGSRTALALGSLIGQLHGAAPS